ncbi:MAG TPA: hypothetical protein VNI01_14570, partial [Elusimicrobiota bacterium]|nr:hypothetical protein [Elusimicrobiota bacterium]
DRLTTYLERVERGERPVAHAEALEGREKLGETLMLGLRRREEGVPRCAREAEAFAAEIAALAARGLLEYSGERLRLSREGVFLANEVFREFVPPFESSETIPQ